MKKNILWISLVIAMLVLSACAKSASPTSNDQKVIFQGAPEAMEMPLASDSSGCSRISFNRQLWHGCQHRRHQANDHHERQPGDRRG